MKTLPLFAAFGVLVAVPLLAQDSSEFPFSGPTPSFDSLQTPPDGLTGPRLLPVAYAPPPFDRLRTGMSVGDVRAIAGSEHLGTKNRTSQILGYEIASDSLGRPLARRKLLFLTFSNGSLDSAKLVEADAFAAELRAAANRLRHDRRSPTRTAVK